MVHPILDHLRRGRGKSWAACCVRCPITARNALGPTDGQDGLGQGLLQRAAPQHASCSGLSGAAGGSHTILAPEFGLAKAQNLSVGTPSHV
jgi:hypothetical protein